MNEVPRPVAPGQPQIELSVAAQEAAGWFRMLARGLRTFRLYRQDNPVVRQIRDQLADGLSEQLSRHGGWTLRFTPSRVYLEEEVIVKPAAAKPGEDVIRSGADDLPFLFYRDGIRRIRMLPGIPRGEIEAFFEALRQSGAGRDSQDDLVTLVWQANLTHMRLEAVPLEQTIYLHSHRTRKRRKEQTDGQGYAWTPSGSEIHAELGQVAGAQGLHKDTFDDWELPWRVPDVREAYERLQPLMDEHRVRFATAWERERSADWTDTAPAAFRQILKLDSSEEMRHALSHSVVTWVAGALNRAAWKEAQVALSALREIDPDGSRSNDELALMISGLDGRDLTERLDASEAEEHARFAAITVALGRPALPVVTAVLGHSNRMRVRAAASLALSYLAGDDVEMVAPLVADSRWHVVRNAVFVLGQLSGPRVVELLQSAAAHPDPRVRKQVVISLGAVPQADRRPILLAQLDTTDASLLAATLAILTRERDPEVATALLDRIQALDFENRPEEYQRALFLALGEVADDDSVPALEALLNKGGWFARRTLERYGAARTLARIGSEKALAALEAGLRSRSEAVRAASLDALSAGSAT